MAGFDDLDFGDVFEDSGSDFGSGSSSGFGDFDDSDDMDFNQSDSMSGDLGDFESQQLTSGSAGDKKAVIKQAAIIASVGIFVIVLAFVLVRGLTSDKGKDKHNTTQQTQSANTQGNQQSVQNTQSSSTNDWKRFDKAAGLEFSTEYMEATFTITGISHYVKVADDAGSLEVKTELTGSISGLTGTYNLEVPYYKGCQLSKLDKFNVKVQVGDYNGKFVVGEIKY